MTWTGQTFSVGQVLTAAQMNNLQADITAAFNKDSGAPVLANGYVVEAMMAAAAVDRATLDTATVSLSGSVSEQGATDITLTAYSFFPMIHQSVGGAPYSNSMAGHSTDGVSPDAPRFRLTNAQKDGGSTYDVDYRYIDVT